MIRKRYELEDISLKEICSQNETEDSDSAEDAGFPSSGVSFSLADEAGYKSSGTWPETDIAFAVPADDIPRVGAWFTGDYHGVTLPESLTLKKNMSSAVKGALDEFFSSATGKNLFTSPFRIGIAYRLFDGSVTPLQEVAVVSPANSAPTLPILSYSLTGKQLSTRVQIRNVPVKLQVTFNPGKDINIFSKIITSVGIYCTAQSPLYDSAGSVAGVRSLLIDSLPQKCWYYDSYPEEEVLACVNSDSIFRLIHEISFDQLIETDSPISIPVGAGALAKFSSWPLYSSKSDNTGSGATNSGSIGWKPKLHFITEPLHLGYPDDYKRIRNVYLRGVFNRENVVFKLYGSRHREDWQLICTSHSPYICGLWGLRYRWFRIEVESDMRKDDFLDAVTFEFNL